MSFQWVIDNAASISINRKPVVASTTARDGTVRSVSRGGQPWRFEVRLPDGPKWTEYRADISKIEYIDRHTTDTIQINNSGHDWLIGYQGNAGNDTLYTASWVQGSTTVNFQENQSVTSGFHFKAGDVVQLGSSGRVYTVAEDVPYTESDFKVHRPIIDATGTGVTMYIGDDVTWTVQCTQFPEWNLFARDQVSWSGPFIFVEDMS